MRQQRLTPDQMAKIRRLYESGELCAPAIAQRFGVARYRVTRLARSQGWRAGVVALPAHEDSAAPQNAGAA